MDAIKSQWADLPPNVRGILWVVLSGLLFASFMAIVRHVGTTMNPIQMSFIRYAFGMLFMLPFFMRMQLSDFRAANIKLHATRGILHGLAVMMWFYAMSRIPIAEVTALGFTSPIFATIAAVLLLGERIRRGHVAHHQEAGHIHAEAACKFDVLFGDIGFGAMGCHPDRAYTQLIGVLEIVDRTDAGQQQGGENRVLQHFGHRADPVPVGMSAKAVVEGRPRQPVAMRHLDGIDLRPVQRSGDRLHMIQTVLVADGVHSVAQGDVLNIELGGGRIKAHAAAPSCILATIRSAVLSAAEVIISRLPA